MTYRALLAEDEPLALQRLQRLLLGHGATIAVVGIARNGPEALEKIRALRPEVVFLDIQMPGLDGFQVLRSLDSQPLVIFCTAYDEYALRAFETHSIDYLLKPIEAQRLDQAIRKLLSLTRPETNGLQQRIDRLLASLASPTATRISVRVGDAIRLIPISEVCFFLAADKYVEVHTYDETFLIDDSLKVLETRLPGEDFARIHRAAIVNLAHVGEIFRWFSGGYRVRMRDKAHSELAVSRAYRSRLGL